MGKYDDLILALPVDYHNWYGFASPRAFLRGATTMPGSGLYWDFTAVTKPLPMEHPHTHHAVDEYLIFVGGDMANFFEFDAEVDVWIGSDPDRLEMYTLTEPTLIRVPPKMYHCPVNFRVINKPIMFSAVYSDGDWSKIGRRLLEDGTEEFLYDGAGVRRCVYDRAKECVYCGKCFSEKQAEERSRPKPEDAPQMDFLLPYYEMAKSTPRTGEFDRFVHTFSPERHDDPRFLNPRAAFRGAADMEGARIRYEHDIVLSDCEIGGPPHMHPGTEEYLFFSGPDISKFFEFGALAEIDLGESPDSMETYRIAAASVVRVPAGLWHGPVRFRSVKSPVHFLPVHLRGEYGRVLWQGGKYVYEGTDLPK